MNINYTIGEVSIITKVSKRMIRYYEQKKLIHPKRSLNGYRQYDTSAIELIKEIKTYQHYNFSLANIKKLLTLKNKDTLYEHKIRELLSINEDNLLVINKLMNITANKKISPPINAYHITTGYEEQTLVIYENKRITIDSLDQFITEFFKKIVTYNIMPLLPYCIKFSSLTADSQKFDIEIRQPIESINLDDQSLNQKIIPTNFYVKTLHKGSYEAINHAYEKLYTWIDCHNYTKGNSSIERYYIDTSHTNDEDNLLTEILIPVKK